MQEKQDKVYITDLQEDSEVTLACRLHDRTAEFKCTVEKVSETFICLDVPLVEGKALSFDGVAISIIGSVNDILYKFPECVVARFKGKYIAKGFKPGTKINRRGSFRVGVSVLASLVRNTDETVNVYVRDVSASGYSITTEKELAVGEQICIRFDDMGMRLPLIGTIVRMEEVDETKKIYGVQMIKPPAIMENYINAKQRDILRKKRGK